MMRDAPEKLAFVGFFMSLLYLTPIRPTIKFLQVTFPHHIINDLFFISVQIQFLKF